MLEKSCVGGIIICISKYFKYLTAVSKQPSVLWCRAKSKIPWIIGYRELRSITHNAKALYMLIHLLCTFKNHFQYCTETQCRTQKGMGGPDSPLFQHMILELCPKMLENYSRRASPHICKSLKGVIEKFYRCHAPRFP